MGSGRIFDETTERGMWELTHEHVFVKNGEAWYRDPEREISARDLMREIGSKHVSQTYSDIDNETLDELLAYGLRYGTDSIEGVISLCYMTICEAADMRAFLEACKKYVLPTTMRPEVLRQSVDTYGNETQTDIAIEEMSELSKALLKYRRLEKHLEDFDCEQMKLDIYGEIADVIIMLTQLLMIYGGREEIKRYIDRKVSYLEARLRNKANVVETRTRIEEELD